MNNKRLVDTNEFLRIIYKRCDHYSLQYLHKQIGYSIYIENAQLKSDISFFKQMVITLMKYVTRHSVELRIMWQNL